MDENQVKDKSFEQRSRTQYFFQYQETLTSEKKNDTKLMSIVDVFFSYFMIGH